MIPLVRQDSAWSPAIHNTEMWLLPLRDPCPRGAPSAGSNNPRPSISALPSVPLCAPGVRVPKDPTARAVASARRSLCPHSPDRTGTLAQRTALIRLLLNN